MKKQAKGFMDFVREQGVVGLAVGLAIGTQVTTTVNAIVKGLINPVVGFILGSNTKALEQATWTFSVGRRQMIVGWGLILSSLITLLAVAAVIYFIVGGLGLAQLSKDKEAAADSKADDKSEKNSNSKKAKQ